MKVHKSVTADRVTAICLRDLRDVCTGGICLHCGEDADEIPPDVQRYRCRYCNLQWVYGGEKILALGLCYGSGSGKVYIRLRSRTGGSYG